ncbi:putative ankyrin repeat domain-containing protein 26-like protein isoform X1 [Camelus dromedarius]|uniref:putative ankyrin repeat domain-containing protein 26-like protein isoform X1 n=1 Tax=Camelus dromedarius TaxID=9838 RepID=UPI00311920BF
MGVRPTARARQAALLGSGTAEDPTRASALRPGGGGARRARADAQTGGCEAAALCPERVGAGGSRVLLDQPLRRNAAWGPDSRLSSPTPLLPGRTALHLASANGHGDVVTLLLERGCQVDAQDRKKRTALIKAVQCEAEECVDILLKSGANVNAADVLGNTALHYAARLDTASIAEKLLSHAADMDAKNQDDLTPLFVARRENRQRMAEYLNEKQANMPTVEKTKSEHKDERRRETPFQTTSLAKTSDCETAVYSAEDKDAQSPDMEEGVTHPEIHKEETGMDTDAGDEGAPEEPTDEKKWTSVDGTDTPDMAVKL